MPAHRGGGGVGRHEAFVRTSAIIVQGFPDDDDDDDDDDDTRKMPAARGHF